MKSGDRCRRSWRCLSRMGRCRRSRHRVSGPFSHAAVLLSVGREPASETVGAAALAAFVVVAASVDAVVSFEEVGTVSAIVFVGIISLRFFFVSFVFSRLFLRLHDVDAATRADAAPRLYAKGPPKLPAGTAPPPLALLLGLPISPSES